jgi:leader peptidase (prepilin peptidase)/N-methyltransferase
MYSVFDVILPTWIVFLLAGGLGVIIGSFLNVVIYRFHTGKSLAGSSHCLSCGKPLRWYELFPLVSYLVLQGRCSGCGSRIPVRYFLVELLTAALFAAAVTLSTAAAPLVIDPVLLLFHFAIISVLVVITVYDLYHFIIPDSLTALLTALVAGLIGYFYYEGAVGWADVGVDVLAALAGSGFLLFLWTISRGQWLGFGDVKLAFPLGLLVGAGQVFTFVVLSFWIGAAISLAIIGISKWRRGKADLQLSERTLTMKSAVPFAPFLVASSLVVLLTHFDALRLFSF